MGMRDFVADAADADAADDAAVAAAGGGAGDTDMLDVDASSPSPPPPPVHVHVRRNAFKLGVLMREIDTHTLQEITTSGDGGGGEELTIKYTDESSLYSSSSSSSTSSSSSSTSSSLSSSSSSSSSSSVRLEDCADMFTDGRRLYVVSYPLPTSPLECAKQVLMLGSCCVFVVFCFVLFCADMLTDISAADVATGVCKAGT
jgi:hypothetical protein